MTSYRLTCSSTWEDVAEVTEYVHKKYVMDSGKARCKFYGYGTSLGGNLLGLYLIHKGNSALFDGATLFSPPYNIEAGEHHFFNHCYGIYSWVIG